MKAKSLIFDEIKDLIHELRCDINSCKVFSENIQEIVETEYTLSKLEAAFEELKKSWN